MAQVTTDPTTLDRFERQFATAIGDWEQLPEMAAEWPEWDVESRMDFLTDWPVAEERTARLLALEAALSPGDTRVAKLRELRALVTRNRPVLKYLDEHVLDK